jgi:hypothetical protein
MSREGGASGVVACVVASLWAAPAWAAAGSGALLAVFGVSLLAGIITGFAQVLFMMVAVSAPERPPSVWLRVFAAANAAIGAFIILYFAINGGAIRTASDALMPVAFGGGGIAFGGFGLWWRRGAGSPPNQGTSQVDATESPS